MPKQSIDQFLTDAEVALTNAQADADLIAGLTLVGYDADRLSAGQGLFDAAQTLYAAQQAEYGEQVTATEAFTAAYAAAHAAYMRHVKLARIVFEEDGGAAVALDLFARRKRTFAGWVEQARQFYDNLLADPDRVAAMATVGQTEAMLTEARALVEAAAAANAVQENEKGEAQQATQERDAAFDALDAWMSTFLRVARVAFEDEPQHLEKLGLHAPS